MRQQVEGQGEKKHWLGATYRLAFPTPASACNGQLATRSLRWPACLSRLALLPRTECHYPKCEGNPQLNCEHHAGIVG